MSDVTPPTSGPGRARRSNGLHSSEWGALVDLDPRLSEALLARLEAAGVPAFVEPASGEDGFSRAAQHPARPLDRLWVDPALADAARVVVAEEVAELSSLLAEGDPGATAHGFVQPVPRTAAARVLTPPSLPDPPSAPLEPPATEALGREAPGPEASAEPGEALGGDAGTAQAPPSPGADPRDEDEAWRRIVEEFDREAEGTVAPWPAAEDVDPSPRPRRLHRAERTPEPPPVVDPSHPRRRRDDSELPSWVEPEALEDDGHFVPPPAPPVPRLAPQKAAAAAAVLVGFLLMFAPGLLLQPRTTGVAVFGILVTLAGAAAVVYLMRDVPPDSGPDDGAVV
ncbi:MAG: hypothetical protein JWN88_2070 [Frankiales bacterium]|nr:hypothetical protein [Frankiales bacterium]